MSRVLNRKTVSLKAPGRWAFLRDIRIRLVVAIVLVTFSVSLVGLFFNLSRDMDRIRQATVETNLVRLKALKIDFVKVIVEYSPDYAVDLIDRLSSFSDICNVILHDNKGRLVFRYDSDPSNVLELPDFVDFSEDSAIVHGKDGLLIHHMVTYEGNHFGWVTIRVSTLKLQDQIREYALTLLLLAIGTAMIAVVLSFLVGHYFTSPIRILAAFTRLVSRTREFDRKVYTREGGDVGDLYNGMNKMLKEISVAEQEIQRLNESRMRNIIESSLDGVVSINAEGLITYWGRQNVEIFGWAEDEVLGQPIDDLIIPERFKKQHNDRIQQFLTTGEGSLMNQRIKLSGLHRDGHEFPVEISLAANKEADGWVFNAFIRDLTELREAEKDLHEAQVQLLRKERLAAVGQVTATVAHELRNPMGTIRNSLYSLSRKLDKKDCDIIRLVERVDRNVQRCDVIITELLDFTRDRQVMLLPTAIDDWLGKLLNRYDCPKQVELVRTLSSDVTIPLDTAYFESAVVNVLDNAVQAVLERYPDGGGRIEVDVVTEPGRVGVVISDNGPGIAEEDRLHVFEPLYSNKVYGVGLGLPTVKKIMEKHGGEVALETSVGGGVRITLWLKTEVQQVRIAP